MAKWELTTVQASRAVHSMPKGGSFVKCSECLLRFSLAFHFAPQMRGAAPKVINLDFSVRVRMPSGILNLCTLLGSTQLVLNVRAEG